MPTRKKKSKCSTTRAAQALAAMEAIERLLSNVLGIGVYVLVSGSAARNGLRARAIGLDSKHHIGEGQTIESAILAAVRQFEKGGAK